jgi:hypothetical protein
MVADGQSDNVDDVLVVDEVDLPFTLAAGPYQAGELEFAEVVAGGGDALPDLLGQGADVAFAFGEQPHEVQPHGGREQSEGGRGVLQQLSGQCAWRRDRRVSSGANGHGLSFRARCPTA